MLKQVGIASGVPRVQVHADRCAGGLGHRHIAQGAAASIADQFDKIIMSEEDTPGRAAVMAHIHATCTRLGWAEREHVLEWHTTHMEEHLSEDMVVEAWMKHRIRAGLKIKVTGE